MIRSIVLGLMVFMILAPVVTIMALGKVGESVEAYAERNLVEVKTCYLVQTGENNFMTTTSAALANRLVDKNYKVVDVPCYD